MKYVILVFTLIFNIHCFAQNVEFIAGINNTLFYDSEDHPRFSADYDSEVGYAIKIAFESENENKFRWRAVIGFEKYGGRINVFDGGFGGGNRVQAEIDKTNFTLAFYPLNTTIWDKVDLSLGAEFIKLFRDDYIGTNTQYSSFSSTTTVTDLKKLHSSYNSQTNFGVRGRIAYNITISENFILTPQISYFLGLTKEFKAFPRQTLSMRPFFGLGLKKAL